MRERWGVALRPRKFSEVVGQTHVVNFFKSVLNRFYKDQTTLPTGVLFGGLSGVGKTTLARVVGSSLNCRKRDGVEPCGECESCRAIWSGEGGVWEIDAAFFGLADNVRSLRDRLGSYSFVDYQVVILDECHMMSREAFNILLKVLEDPPKNVLFILVTTEPDKVLDTVRSRLVEFRFKAIPQVLVLNYLRGLLTAEGVECDDDLLSRIYQLSNHNFRDVIVNLEQLSVLGEGKITPEIVRDALGDIFLFDKLIASIIEEDFVGAVTLYEDFAKFQSNPVVFVENLTNFVVNLLKVQLQSGRDTTKYMFMLKSIYKFTSSRSVIKGEAAIKLLLFDMISALRGDKFVAQTEQVTMLSGKEVLEALTK